jgi:hypothetical protein
MSEQERNLPYVKENGAVELDWENPLRLPQRGAMYKLPARGLNAFSDDQWISTANPVRLRVFPAGAGASASIGGFLFLSLLMFVAIFFICVLIYTLRADKYFSTLVAYIAVPILLIQSSQINLYIPDSFQSTHSVGYAATK